MPSARSPGGNQGSRVTRRRPALRSRPGRSRQLRSRRLLGAGRRPAASRLRARVQIIPPPRLHLPSRDPARVGLPQQKGAPPAESPPRPGFPRPRPRPRGNRSRVAASRYPEGEGARRQQSGGQGGGKARRRAPRQPGAGLRAVPPRHWRAPPLRPPLIGECSNSVSRRQRRCFSGDGRRPGLELR